MLDGLAYAHAEGIVHRDVKPANVLLTRRGQAVLTDFGSAQIVGTTRYTMSGALMGTLNYMAPEQGLEGHGEVRSDIYSVGIMFFEMVTGRTPYDADTPLAILMKHLNDPPPLPHKLAPDLPEALERVILKGWPSSQKTALRAQRWPRRCKTQRPGRIGVPERISLPQVRTAGPAAPAAVSGEARQHISDHGFAVDDTDADLASSRRWPPGRAASRNVGRALGFASNAASLAGNAPDSARDSQAAADSQPAGSQRFRLDQMAENASRLEADFEELGTRLEADFENLGTRLGIRVTAQVKEAVAALSGEAPPNSEAATKLDGGLEEENIVFASLRGVGMLAGVNLVGLFWAG
jgi:serine/threonine protein kinase